MRQFTESEQELSVFFTSALGVGAQSYESSGSREFDSDAAVSRFFTNRRIVDEVKDHRRVEWTLEKVGAADAKTLRLAFYPARIGAGPYQAGLGRLAALGVETDAARSQHAAWQALHHARSAVALVDWLDAEATRDSAPRCRKDIPDEAEVRLHGALARYDVVRRERARIEKTTRQASRDAAGAIVARAMGNRPSVRIKAGPGADVVSLSSAIAALLADHQDLIDYATAE